MTIKYLKFICHCVIMPLRWRMTLKELRIKKGLTQLACATVLGVSHRTYIRYETDESKVNTLKYRYMVKELETYGVIDETHGILSLEQIKKICTEVLDGHEVEYCYLFGSYAKGKATETSDIDLLIATPVNGLAFFEIVEILREKLGKKVDALHQTQLNNNIELTNEILRDGIKIYG